MISHLPNAKTRANLSFLAFQGVALVFALAVLPNSIDVAAKFIPLIAMSQIWGALAWLCGGWLAPVLFESRYQLRRWWLIGLLGSCQTLALLLAQHVGLDRQPISSLVQDAPLLKATIIVGLYGAVSALVYVFLLQVKIRRNSPPG